jgi:hypothetical protein
MVIMSTVVLTPTHIACDHTVVQQYIPHETRVDLNHTKLFVDPHKQYIFGTVGKFIPGDVNSDVVHAAMKKIISEYDIHLRIVKHNDVEFIFQDMFAPISRVFDRTGEIIVVTRSHRFVLYYNKKEESWYARQCSDYFGIGSGGMIAAGMLVGKRKLPDIWKYVNQINPVTSVEHTSIPIKSLRPWRKS